MGVVCQGLKITKYIILSIFEKNLWFMHMPFVYVVEPKLFAYPVSRFRLGRLYPLLNVRATAVEYTDCISADE